MRWVSITNRYGSPEFKLDVADPVDLDAAYPELWRRVLTDAVEHVADLDWRTIAFDVLPRELPQNKKGQLTAQFWDANNRPCKWPGYAVVSDKFDVFMEGKEDEEHVRDLLVLYLTEYERLRAVAAVDPTAKLFQRVNALRPVEVVGEVQDGHVDLQIGRPELGPLPEYDRALLAGEPARIESDLGGPLEMEWQRT
jgi:hypothetical protein